MKTKVMFTGVISVAALSIGVVGAQAGAPVGTPYAPSALGGSGLVVAAGAPGSLSGDMSGVAGSYEASARTSVDAYLGGITDNSISTLFASNKTSADPSVFQFSNTTALPGQTVDRSDDGQMRADDVFQSAVTPEPSTWAMMILGVFGVGAMVRRRPKGVADVHIT